jgi:hypothetical protein
MDTRDLLEKFLREKYLKEETSYTDITLDDYEINGSVIELTYSYKPNYDWKKDYISYDNTMRIYILDYITWVYNQCKV